MKTLDNYQTYKELAKDFGLPPEARAELVDSSLYAEELKALELAFECLNGTIFNLRSTRLEDFEYQFIEFIGMLPCYGHLADLTGASSWPRDERQFATECLFRHKVSGRTILTDVGLWKVGDHWTVCAELSQMDGLGK